MIGSPALLAVIARFGLGDVDEGPDDDVVAVVGGQSRRHGLQRAGEKQIEQYRLDEVIEMVTERDLGGAGLLGQPVEHPTAQPGTERTRRVVALEFVVNHCADRGVLAVKLPPALLAGGGDLLVLVAFVAGVDVDGDDRKIDRRALLQHVEDLDQRPAVLSS
jgi:hypothetical protein